MTTRTTHTLETDGATITYDVRGPLPPADGRPPLLMIGQPMAADGFAALAAQFKDRTVVTYDPRGLGRSTRSDGRTDQNAPTQAADVHAVIAAIGGPVELFASSGGAVTALELVRAYPDDVVTLVAHEPPIIDVLPDAEATRRACELTDDTYKKRGWGPAMAVFIAMTSWEGEFTDEYFAQPLPDPAQYGMPAADDGSRDDPLLSESASAITDYQPDIESLKTSPVRIVIAAGTESYNLFPGRCAVALAEELGQEATIFPSHHGGFVGPETGWPGEPEEFGKKLREVLG